MSLAAPGVTVASQTAHLRRMKPLQSFIDQTNPDSTSPDPFGLPPSNYTSTCCNPIPPVLSDRALGLESRSFLMGTLLDSVQSYGATRSRPPAPQATVSGKHDSSPVTALVSRNDRQKFVRAIRIPSTPSQTPLSLT